MKQITHPSVVGAKKEKSRPVLEPETRSGKDIESESGWQKSVKQDRSQGIL